MRCSKSLSEKVLQIISFPSFLQDLENILIVRRQNILLDRPRNSLESLMRLTLGIIVLHILQRSKRSLNRDIEALVPGIVKRLPDRSGNDVRLSVLRALVLIPVYGRCAYLGRSLREHLVLLQQTQPIRLVGDLEEGDAFDGGHCG